MKKLKAFYSNIFFHPNFYLIWAGITLLIFLGYWLSLLFEIGRVLLFTFIGMTLLDFLYLWRGGTIEAERNLPEKMSNGDENIIKIHLKSWYNFPVDLVLIDELPVQFQKRDFKMKLSIEPGEEQIQKYSLKPVKRGVYEFGKLNVFIYSPIKLAGIRKRFFENTQVKVYPSFIQMRKYELLAFSNKTDYGIKKVRRLGHTMEFEQIKVYNQGDDYRTINWKATAKLQKLMVNQYQDEKSQNIYSLIDMGRQMALPFNQMTLLDYAINATLSFSNVAMKKKDKAGLLSFERNITTFIKPDNSRQHLQQIFEHLYNLKTAFKETDYERLYRFVRRKIPTRSLLMIYTNFEHINSMRRQLPYLKKIARKHLVVVVIFKNTELQQLIKQKADDSRKLYHKIITEDFDWQKRIMVKELALYNIHAILTEPQNLTTNVINKYLQLKSRGLI